MNATPNYNSAKAVAQACGVQAPPPPPPPTDSYWNSPRSDLEVRIGALRGPLVAGQAQGVVVNLNGFVDTADAMHLEEFFRTLKKALPPLR
jgi:hypothetical protein